MKITSGLKKLRKLLAGKRPAAIFVIVASVLLLTPAASHNFRNTDLTLIAQEAIASEIYDYQLDSKNSAELTAANIKAEEEAVLSAETTRQPEPTAAATTQSVNLAAPTPTPTKVFDVQPYPPLSNNCPIETRVCIPCNAGEPLCRYVQGATTGYKGWSCQNNNPGNIRYSQSRINLIIQFGGQAPCGSKGPSPDSQYMVFATYSTGRNALKAYITAISAGAHSSYLPACADGACSLREFFSIYAPAGDQNDPNSYSNFVANYIGENVDTTPLGWIVANKLDLMVNAIQQFEGFFTL